MLAYRYAWVLDDAFIYFRYIDNAHFLGIGLVYNEGEYVEGFSSPGWMLSLWLLRAMHMAYWPMVLALGGLAFVGFWYGLVRLNRILGPGRAGWNLPLVYLTANYGVLSYFTSGLETPLIQLWSVLLALAVVRPRSLPLQFAVAFAPMVRPELTLPMVLWFIWATWKERRVPWRAFLLILSVNGIWLLFRVLYYADLYPNTFYLKHEHLSGQGWVYLQDTLSTYHLLIAAMLLCVLPLWKLWGRRSEVPLRLGPRAVMLGMAFSVAGYVIYIGGDPRHYRYLAFPFCMVVCSWSGLSSHVITARFPRPSYLPLGAAAVAYLVVASFYPPPLDRHPITHAEKHRMVKLINDASYHRHDPKLQPEVWRLTPEAYVERARTGRERYPNQPPMVSMASCVLAYLQPGRYIVNSYGLIDGVLAHVNLKTVRPAHNPGLVAMASELIEARLALGWGGPGMYRAMVAKGIGAPWMEANLGELEVLEARIYNRKKLFENLGVALGPAANIELQPGAAANVGNASHQGSGRYRRLRSRESSDARKLLTELEAIGYSGGTNTEERSGVTVFDSKQIQPGLNFYSSGHAPNAVLMDLQGRVVHSWDASYERVFPGSRHAQKNFASWWRRVRLLENGDIIAVFEGLAILRLDKDSNVLWAYEIPAHHDFEVLPEGDILVLTRKPRLIPEVHATLPILEDFLVRLTPTGEVRSRISLVMALQRHDPELLTRGKLLYGDILHTNTLHLVGPGHSSPGFPAGSVLTSMNGLGLLCVIDPEDGRITWAYRKSPDGQHDPQIVAGSHVLYFDNREAGPHSAIHELDPISGKPVWSYTGSDENPFYSRFCGAVQRLPNGNTLITESEGGRAFEIRADGEIVWEYYNPERAGEAREYIALISKMERVASEATLGWLTERSPANRK